MNAFHPFKMVIVLLCLGLSLHHSFAQADLDRGVNAYWSLDSCTTNESLNGLPGTDLVLVGAPSYSYGHNGSKDEYGALYFNGGNYAHLRTPLPNSQVSLSLKFNTNNSTGGTIAGFKEFGYGIRLNEKGRLYAYLYTSGNDFFDFLLEGINLADGQWHHAAITFDGGIFKVFLDGRQVHASQTSSTPQQVYFGADKGLFLGGMANGAQKMFIGKIDEVLLYNRAINAIEVLLLAKDAVITWDKDLETGLLVHLPLAGEDVNHSPNHTDAIEISVKGGIPAAPCKPEKAGMTFFNGQEDHVTLRNMFQLIDSFSLAITFSTGNAKESVIAGWEKGGYQIIFSPEGMPEKLLVRFFLANEKVIEFLSPRKVNDGECHTVILTFDGQKPRAFLDGHLLPGGQEEASNNQIHYASDLLWVGNMKDSLGWAGFQGLLSEFRLYNRTLTQDEIKELSQGSPASSDLIVRQYNLGGSRRNGISPKGCVVLLYNPSDSNNDRVLLTPNGQADNTRKIRVKPQEQVFEEFTGVPSELLTVEQE